MFPKFITTWWHKRKQEGERLAQEALCSCGLCDLELTKIYEQVVGCQRFVCKLYTCPVCDRAEEKYSSTLVVGQMNCLSHPDEDKTSTEVEHPVVDCCSSEDTTKVVKPKTATKKAVTKTTKKTS